MKVYFTKVKAGTYIGLDLATKSGWAIIRSDGTDVELVDYGSISLPRGKEGYIRRLQFLEQSLIPTLDKYLLNKFNTTVIIENCFLGKWNPRTFKLLAWCEGFIMHLILYRYRNPTPALRIPTPSHARKLVGIKGNAKKDVVVAGVNKLLQQALFKIEHNNICDAIVLALSGGVK